MTVTLDHTPVLASIGPKTVDEESTLSFTVSANDGDGDDLIFFASDLPSGATFDSASGSFTWTPTNVQAGTYQVTFEVTDGQLTDSETITLTVNEGSITPIPNRTPLSTYDNRLRESSPDAVFSDNNCINIGHHTDVGRYRDVIWFNLSMYNTTATISTATLSLYWYYPEDSTRNKDTVVEIYRPVDWDPDYVSWNHRTSDTPWNAPGGDWFDENEVAQGSVSYASVTFTGSDVADNRYYEFDVTKLVQDYITGEYENTGFFLKAQDEYDNYISFYSSDWSNVNQRPKLTVTLDHTPVLASIGPKTVDEESTLSFTVSANDGDDLIFFASDLPSGATFDSASGSFTWTPTNGQAGTYQVTFEVTDGQLTYSETITLTVNEGSIILIPNGTASSVYDNRLRKASPDRVLSDNPYVDIGDCNGVASFRDVIWFNLNMYNTTDTISNATLSLYWYYPEDSTRNNNTVVEIYRPVDWDPDYVSWNHRTSDTPWNTPGGDWFDKNEVAQGSVSYASVTFTGSDVPDNRYYDFDVTELVQDYISGEYENTGFFLKAQDEYDNYIAFYSSDWSNVDQRPKLTVITLDHAQVSSK